MQAEDRRIEARERSPATATRASRVARAARALAVAAVAYVCGVAFLIGVSSRWVGFHDYTDTPVYYRFARSLAGGLRPYADFPVEYPPLALLLFTAPGHTNDLSDFTIAFNLEMLAIAGVCALVTSLCAHALWPRGRGPYLCGMVFGGCVAALGPVIANRYDAAVALLVATALAFLALRRPAVAAVALGLGFALKLTPAVLLPLVVIVAESRAAIVRSVLAFAVAAAAPFAPYLGTSGIREVFTYHLQRPVQLESVLSTPILLAHALGLVDARVATGYGAQFVVAPGAGLVASASGPLLIAALAATYAVAWRARAVLRAAPDTVPLAAAAVLLALLTSGKVLSPQFFAWLVPVAALVIVRAPVVGALLAVTFLATQLEFPVMYASLWDLERAGIAALALRNALLVASFAAALVALTRARASATRS